MVSGKRLFASFGYALEGVLYGLKKDQNLRIHVFATFFVIGLGIYFGVSALEMAILVLTITIVFIAELANTAIEEMIDIVVNEHRKEAKAAKDVAASMVLTSAIGAVIIAAIIFLPHILPS